ncbi:hypothetical protein ACIQLJ_13930 [Microbacterium sp. NPDC091313]
MTALSSGPVGVDADVAEVAVVLVARNAFDDVCAVLPELEREARGLRLRVVVVVCGAGDGTAAMLTEYPDVVTVAVPGGTSPAAAVDAGVARVGDAEAVLLLSPEFALDRAAIPRMLACLRSDARIGAVAPLVRGADGSVRFTQRREPSLLRAVGDRLFPGRVSRRPGAFAERVTDPVAYAWARRVDWVEASVLMLDLQAARRIGRWDDRFGRTAAGADMQRRLRAGGWAVWFEPAAGATLRRAGEESGETRDDDADRLLYIRTHHPRSGPLLRMLRRRPIPSTGTSG